MPRQIRDPACRLHKQSGQAIVTLSDGLGGRRDVLLGAYNSPESRQQYRKVLVEWETNGRRVPPKPEQQNDLTVNELLLAYYCFAKGYYVKDGRPTSEVAAISAALRFVRELYGLTYAADFSPLCLKAVRQAMVEHPITVKIKANNAET